MKYLAVLIKFLEVDGKYPGEPLLVFPDSPWPLLWIKGFQICKAFFYRYLNPSSQTPHEGGQANGILCFPISLIKKLKPRDSKTRAVTQGLVLRRALCLVSRSVATFLKFLALEPGDLHFHFALGPASDEGGAAGRACLAHTRAHRIGAIEWILVLSDVEFTLPPPTLHFRQIWDL